MARGYSWQAMEKLVQELAWRDYWQLIWLAKGEAIHTDLKTPQDPITNRQIPKAVLHARTGIQAVDAAIRNLYATGYLHNHMRMYIASICCNVANSHWLAPARWMYAHLLDGDLASNQLSWQWIAGTFSSKKYYANQENINRFFNSKQKNTFLDIGYEEFNTLAPPPVLRETCPFQMVSNLPKCPQPALQANQTTLIYTYYNLDPSWHEGEEAQRILLLEPSLFERHPVNRKGIDFALALARNIPGIKSFAGEFHELEKQLTPGKIIYKEHPLNRHFKGHAEPREWLSTVTGDFPSFFAFWKKCKKELRR